MNRIRARFGARSVHIQELFETGCRIEHAAPLTAESERPIVFRCGGESFFLIARSYASNLTASGEANRYESILQFVASRREIETLSSVLRARTTSGS